MYDWTLSWADRPGGVRALFALAVVESSVFPIPPDVLGMALCAGKPKRSFYFAAVCSVGSVLGGVLGYAIGMWLWEQTSVYFFRFVPGFTPEVFEKVRVLYETNAFWVVFTAAFTPIPYKVITIAAGVFHISFPVFLIASVIGRSLRFFLWAGMIYFFGPAVKQWIEKYFEIAVTAFTVLLLGGFWVLSRFLGH